MTIRAINTPAARAKRGVLMLALIVGAVVIGPQAFAGGSTDVIPSDTYTVIEGETLWSIANSVSAPGDSVHDTVREIQELNQMADSSLRAGQQILVPQLG
jgi:Tfp pilus assembly protein FimV